MIRLNGGSIQVTPYNEKFYNFDPSVKKFNQIKFPSLDSFYSSSSSLIDRNIEIITTIKKDINHSIFRQAMGLLPLKKKEGIANGTIDFDADLKKNFILAINILAEDQYLKNHAILSKLMNEYGPDIFKKVFEEIFKTDYENSDPEEATLSGLKDLTPLESSIFELADQYLKPNLISLIINKSELIPSLKEKFSAEIINKAIQSLSVDELKEYISNPKSSSPILEKIELIAKDIIKEKNDIYLSELNEDFNEDHIKLAIENILTPEELTSFHTGIFDLSTKKKELSDYFYSFSSDTSTEFEDFDPKVSAFFDYTDSVISTETDNFIGDFDLRKLNSNLKFDPSNELNNCSKFSQNFRVFKWRAEGKDPEINVALASRHGPTDNTFLENQTPAEISKNLSDAGFRSMISLSDYDIGHINYLWASHGEDHTRLCHPIADYSAPNHDTIKEIYDYALESAKKGKNLIINCGEGFGRSGVIMAGMLIYSYYNELKSTPDLLKEILTKECNKTKIKTLSAIEETTTTTVKFAINSIRAGDNDRGTSVETKDQIRCLENLETIIRENLKAELKI